MKKILTFTLCLMLLSSLFLPALAEDEITIPELTIAQRPIPDNEAMAFLKSLGTGWNLGNTFDAVKGDWNRNADEMTVETSWVGVKTSEELIAALQEAGFSSIRVPVSWHDHLIGDDYELSEPWLARVQEVVDWAYNRGMHVILNIHHDEDQFEPSPAHYDESARYIERVWTQLADRFRDYDDHLIFESMNEPRLMNSRYEWYFDTSAKECLEAADCLNRLNQLFVDTVRASGGNNETRYLMVPGYDADPYNACRDSFVLPKDSADNRLIVSVHAYTPYDFALNLSGTNDFKLNYTQPKADIVGFMNKLYDQYIMNGIPVVIGEYGALDKKGNLQSRVDWTAFYVATASARNLPCFWWDNHGFTGNGELFGLIDRKTCAWKYPEIMNAITRYAGYDTLPAAQQ